jgi:hypothetical protein
MSDAPVITPYIPLSESIKTMGSPPTAYMVYCYIQRLRERGWDPEITIARLEDAGLGIGADGTSMLRTRRIPGVSDDKKFIGPIIWATDKTTGKLWPGEVLDPLDMPRGSFIPTKAAEKLKSGGSAASTRVLVVFFPHDGRQGNCEWFARDPKVLIPFSNQTAERERVTLEALRR